jgi:hypothetical protein
MNRKRIRLLLAFLLSAFVLNGCGTALYEMTAEEEQLVVQYAAYHLAKNNIYQKDGLVNVSDELLNEEEETESVQENPEQESSDTVPSDTTPSITPAAGTTLGDAVTLAQAVGSPGGLSVSCLQFYQADSYKEGSHYSVEPRSGDSFVVMEFYVENTTGEAMDLDILSYSPRFRISYDGSTWVDETTTLLLYDFSTYQGTLGAGESQQMVLLFETSLPEDAGDTAPMLSVVNGNVTHPVTY